MTDEEYYNKYPHIIRGSIENIIKGTVIKCGKNDKITSHGRTCIIKCQTDGGIPGCHKTRMINLQDARQVKHCKFCVKYMRNLRKRQKRSRK
jgi:hypothetical protein